MQPNLAQDKDTYSPRHIVLMAITIIFVFCLYPLSSMILQNEYAGLITNQKAPSFQLYDTQGKTISLADFNGKYIYLMFGFLRCSKVCHTQAVLLESLDTELQRSDVHYVYLAMDSHRDKPTALHRYFDQQGKNFTSLHAAQLKEMQALADAFNAGFRIDGNPNSNSYSIEHPARVFLVDPEGNLRLVYTGNEIDKTKIIADLQRLAPTLPTATTERDKNEYNNIAFK